MEGRIKRGRAERLASSALAVWTIAVVQVVLLLQVIAVSVWTGFWYAAELAIPGEVAFALVGALIAAHRASERMGWILLFLPIPGLIAFLCSEYIVLDTYLHVYLPLAAVVAWVSDWVWTPSVGILVAMVIVRFPDGRVPRGWRFVDVLGWVGTVMLGGALAWIVFPGASHTLTPPQIALVSLGLAISAAAAVAALISLWWRYKRGDRDLRLKLKWMLLATMVLTVALVVAAVLEAAFSGTLSWVLAPFYAATISVPIAIGVAILKHRLFDVDVIISRTLVYVIATAILGGMYIGVIELMQQISILYTGQRSETAIVLTAFVVAGAFTPVQKWIDNVVERRYHGHDVAARLHAVSTNAESALRVIDPHRFGQWLVDESVKGFEAEGAMLYLYGYHESNPFHVRGTITAEPALEIPVTHRKSELGKLLLGRRRGGVEYSHRDIESLTRSAGALAAALTLASDLGHLRSEQRLQLAPEPASAPARAQPRLEHEYQLHGAGDP